jgi:hypothetical protein
MMTVLVSRFVKVLAIGGHKGGMGKTTTPAKEGRTMKTLMAMVAGRAGPVLLLALWAAFMPARAATAGGPAPLAAAEAGKINIAVAELKAEGTSASDAAVITGLLRNSLVKYDSISVVDKSNMDRILSEQTFQQTGCTTQECAVKLGKLLNVKCMVVGSFGKLLSSYFLNVNLVDVESGRIISAESERVSNIDEIERSVGNLANRIAIKATGKLGAQMTTSSPVPVEKTPEPEPVVREQPVRPAVDPRIAGGRIGMGLNFPGAGLRWFVVDRFAVEAKFQYEKAAMAAGPRMYLYISSLGSIFPYIGIEGVYAEFKDGVIKSTGYAAGGFIGGEVYLHRRFSLQFDFGPVYVSLKDTEISIQSIQSGGVGFIVNFGLTYYFGGGR